MLGDSHSEGTSNMIKEIIGDDSVDFLFIDGDHTYEGVKKDFDMYHPMVREGGIVAFHDIRPGPLGLVGGVPDFWKEVSARYQSKVIVDPSGQHGCGIGVLFL